MKLVKEDVLDAIATVVGLFFAACVITLMIALTVWAWRALT